MVFFDYFLLYNYHKKYYGFYGQLILNTSKNLDDQKGLLLQNFFQEYAYGFQLNDLQNSLSFKTNYSDSKFL